MGQFRFLVAFILKTILYYLIQEQRISVYLTHFSNREIAMGRFYTSGRCCNKYIYGTRGLWQLCPRSPLDCLIVSILHRERQFTPQFHLGLLAKASDHPTTRHLIYRRLDWAGFPSNHPHGAEN